MCSCIPRLAPEIRTPYQQKMKVREYRRTRPFVIKNLAEYEAALKQPCSICGYVGALQFHPQNGGRRPQACLYASRNSFLKALQSSLKLCCNCTVVHFGTVHRKGRRRVQTFGISMSNTLKALLETQSQQDFNETQSQQDLNEMDSQ